MLLNSSQMLMPAKALNPRSLLFTCCSKRGVTQHQIGISLWNYQEDNFIYIIIYIYIREWHSHCDSVLSNLVVYHLKSSCVPLVIWNLNCTEISEGDFSPSNSYFMVEEWSTQYLRAYLLFDNIIKIVQRVTN